MSNLMDKVKDAIGSHHDSSTVNKQDGQFIPLARWQPETNII